MRKFILIPIIAITMLLASCCGCGEYKYIITQGDNYYHTNEYTLKDGCITFKDNNKDNTNVGNNVTICGSYTVIEDKNYKPKDDKYRHR